MQFLKTVLAVIVALVIVGFLLILSILGFVAAASSEPPVTVNEGSILKIDLSKPITEQEVANPFEELGLDFGDEGSVGLVPLTYVIERAASDDRIKGILIEPGLAYPAYSSVDEIRSALSRFRESGKFVVAWTEMYSEEGYYLASVADEVYVGPEGLVEFNGLNITIAFFQGLFEKLEIEPEIFRVGEYKSAIEPFVRKDLSDENREQLASLLNSVNAYWMDQIALSREITVDSLMSVANKMAVREPEDAVRLGLIDGVLYRDQVEARLIELVNTDTIENENSTKRKLELISYGKYSKAVKRPFSEDRIAVVIAEGEITGGKSEDNLSSERVMELLRKARENEKVKAVVLRINSPGGQMQASEELWREVLLTDSIKPVIASFSDYAASGGYYMAMGARKIVAEPTTITGSIGIFGMLFNFGPMLEQKLGVTFDEVNTGDLSGMMTITRSLTEAERAIIQKQVENGYDVFIKRVADGRGMTTDQVKAIASGRVWTGLQGKENGLVDDLGGLDRALAIAAEEAGITDYGVVEYPGKRDFFEELMNKGAPSEEKIGLQYFGESYYTFKKIKNLANYQGIQARMPFELTIK